METAALIARLVLALVFVVAAIGKLLDPAGTRRAVLAFGAPARLAWPLAIALPATELAVGMLLLPSRTAQAGIIGALALLLLFSAAIAYNVARGRAPDCHCFGQLHSAPAGWRTLARNGALVAFALFAAAANLGERSPSAVAWTGTLDAAQALALAAAAVSTAVLGAGAFVLLSVLRSYGAVLVRLERIEGELGIADEQTDAPGVGLEPGSVAPAFAAAHVDGHNVGLDDLLVPGLPVLLLFTSPNCGPCTDLLPDVAAWQRSDADRLTIAFASEGDATEVRREAEELGLENVLLDEGSRLYEQFQASGTPSAVLIAADGTIGSWVASGRPSIERLVAEMLEDEPGEAPGLPVGAEVPSLDLRSLEGRPVALTSLLERETLLLFWNPDCGYCRSMHEDVLDWERRANGHSPQLVVISSGEPERSRLEGFRSPVLLDESYAAGEAFGAGGTPMGVLVGADGRVASAVAAGAAAVFQLAGDRPED